VKRLSACAIAVLGVVGMFLAAASAQASFGFHDVAVTVRNEDASTDFQAASHPYEFKLDFSMNLHGEKPDGKLRELFVDLPPGMVGNPTSLPRCTAPQFEGIVPRCPGDTQVGMAVIKAAGLTPSPSPVYNLTPPFGVPASVGFSAAGFNSFQEASLRSAGLAGAGGYGVAVSDITIPTGLEIQSVTETIWGVPEAASHDPERICISSGDEKIEGCASDAPPAPFLSLPTSCGTPLETTLSVDSVENPGVFDTRTVLAEEAGVPTGLDGCNAEEFDPSIAAQPTTNLADSPSGLDFDLHQPQDESPAGLSTAHLRETTVALPAGMTLDPSGANGLGACSEAEVGYRPEAGGAHFDQSPQSCPEASKLGTLEVSTPLVGHRLPGAVYLAKPYQNPFGTLMAIYLVVEDEQTGTIAKLAGKVSADPKSGQLATTVTDSPQLPLQDVALHIFNGARAALKTPLACGRYTTSSTLVPWSAPEGADAHPSDSFNTSVAAGGSGPCPTSEAGAPNKPAFAAGTIAPAAGAYSPFVLKLARADGTQQIAGIDTTLPEGLIGRLAGTATCSDAQLAVARSREAPNMGVSEQQSPACPASSEVGTATVGAGAGPSPFYATGHAYLAGPYKGAPLSLAVIAPAVAGPFDLGDVVVRAALYLDPETARIHAVSDPLPQIIDGVPLDLRSIALTIDRPRFTLNPTSCEPMSILGAAATLPGQSAALSSPFQVGGCPALPYKPGLSLRLTGPTTRGKFPALRAVLSAKAGEADSARVAVTLPHSEFLEQGHFKTICTRVQFAARACPEKSVYGQAKVITPLLDYPLEGPAYLRSSDHNLPDLVLALRGPASQPIEVVLDGRIDSVHRGIRTTFEALPDAPFTTATLTMPGGKKGLLVNSTDVCASVNRSSVQMEGQNGKAWDSRPALVNGKCKGSARKGKRHHRRAGR
jgi:hypothetical protein